ncbi:tetratricopeptide repeat protein 22 isoform X1 [Silurus asotus]|uniref:Tetratricopeptide repeat protein 22 isoform X1 n=1 Tax=Silurus asotus TaxID=30991 RepID=A0AAD5B4A2_SILAS|nr:tetratricopeptide repeat protein 22 isoform X1 [Silurus asotus]
MEETTEEDLESLIEGLDFIPGHFHLLLNLNIEPSEPNTHRLRDTQMKQENLRAELEAETGRLQYAIRNMLGMLAYHLDELEGAEEIFRGICQEDPENLNAWANLAHVYERLGRDGEESECLERVKALMDLENNKSPTESRLRAARCLTEQAFAHLHDVELEKEEDLQERLTTALTLYNRALRYGAELLPQEEKWSWYFNMATIHIKFIGIVNDSKDLENTKLVHFSKGLTLLAETLKSDTIHLKALAWCYIGLMLERKDEFSTVPMSVHDCGLSGSEPLSCYGSGIKLATDDAITLNRLANVFFLSGKNEMSMGICNMALNVLPDAELNWKAYCNRAKLKLTNYVRVLDQAKLGLSGIPDRQDLKEARADLERVLSVRQCLRTYLQMGQVYYYMGVDAVKESIMVDEMSVNQALVSLAHALKCPLGSTLPELQLLRGRCLMLKGEEENAIDCFRQSLELERPGTNEQQALHFLLEALLTSFAKSTGDISHLLTQLEECVKEAEKKHGTETVRTELRLLCRTYTNEVAELSRELVKKGKLGMVRRLLQSIQPHDKPPLCRSLSV